ncbi:MAG: serine/threonine-protein kinase [Peptoniphilaceae bacterium]|nr:serine/threonine-protein kinase [Peptoniphilaceae bacterium]
MIRQAGSVIGGRYTVLRKIGEGGLSVVYMVHDPEENHIWAIKEIQRNGLGSQRIARQGIIAETKILSGLVHPCLPRIREVIEEEESYLLVMEYIEGRPLSRILQEQGVLTQNWVIYWAKQLCSVLEYLHSQSPPVIHRDLKPSNIMVKSDGSLMLIDFGTAEEHGKEGTGVSEAVGTRGYAAPEQWEGIRKADARTDIYSLGVTLYALLTEKTLADPPYELRPIREWRPELSAGLESILLRMTEKDPDRRFSSAAELQAAFQHMEWEDRAYRKTIRTRMRCFLFSSMTALFFALGALLFFFLGESKAKKAYEDILEQAKWTVSMQEKTRLLEEAINVEGQSGRTEAYLAMVHVYRRADVGMQGAMRLEGLILSHAGELARSPVSYSELCLEMGKLFWYGSGENSVQKGSFSAKPMERLEEKRIERILDASRWFEEGLLYLPKDHPKRAMATFCAGIGDFYRNIVTRVVEGEDRGQYRGLFQNLEAYLSDLRQEEGERIRLEAYLLIQNALLQNIYKMKQDGVLFSSMKNLARRLQEAERELQPAFDIDNELRQEMINRQEMIWRSIHSAYKEER